MAFNSLIQGKEVLKCISKYCRIGTFPCTDYSSRSISRLLEHQTSFFQIPVRSLRISTQWARASGKPLPPSDRKPADNTKYIKRNPKITLIGSDNVVTVTTLQAAENISRRYDLKLVRIVDMDTKTERTAYKLMTGAQFYEEDLKQREIKTAKKLSLAIKGVKTLSFSCRISENDLQNRIKKISKWLAKSYEVRVIINNDTKVDAPSATASCEKIYKCIEDAVRENGRFVQKRQGGADLKFQILPPKKEGKDHKDDDAPSHLETPVAV